MKTPIYDFVKQYSESDILRLHMPGHKGNNHLGAETLDITEIEGADSLYEANGIIKESENNATQIFGTGKTYYSAEGSSLSIKTMIYAAMIADPKKRKKIAAVRNVHKSFVNACALLDIDIEWIYPSNHNTLCSGVVCAEEAENFISKHDDVFALYLTSPNYLGELTDIKKISSVCKKHNLPLLVDNAHGAYLKFCNLHPIDLGASMCCDSAHKTLPVITGGAYLHISKDCTDLYEPYIKNGLSIFGSTSPSYLILASLDLCNKILADGYEEKIKSTIEQVNNLKTKIKSYGFDVYDDEPLKLTILTDGTVVSKALRDQKIECEYADKTVVVLMFSTDNKKEDFERLNKAFCKLKPTPPQKSPKILQSEKQLTVREAYMSAYESVSPDDAIGRICATPCVSCPPAIPIVISGEIITKESAELFKFYNIEKIDVTK